jgi:hypothetical protein
MNKHRSLTLVFWALAALLSMQLCNAAEITRERGVNGLPDVIRITGTFNLGDQDRFQSIALTSKKATVYLNSPGGKVRAATDIGTIIRIKGFETAVDNAVCASACALVWLAGEPRMMSNLTSIGFHTSYTTGKDGKRTSSVSDGATIGAYLTRLGFNEKVVNFVTSAGAEDMHWLKKSMADKLGIAVTLTTESTRRKSYTLFADGMKLLTSTPALPYEASKLYRQSAEIGFAGAQNNLGDMYENGEGIPKNDKAAIYWYTRAAERGEPTAYLSLAHMLSEGTNDADLLVESAKFAGLAFTFLPEGKNKASAEQLTKALGERLNPADKERAFDLISRWMPLHQEERLMGDSPRK